MLTLTPSEAIPQTHPQTNGHTADAPPGVSAPYVFLAVPHYGDISPGTATGIMQASKRRLPAVVFDSASLLTFNFNRLWCQCLNELAERGYTHFAMLHADIQPEACWLDILFDEMERTGADVISVVAPIKDSRALTSTGWQDPESKFITRLTMREVLRMPVTFGAEQNPGQWLMVNTGCWLARLDRPWVEQWRGWTITDEIRRTADGKFTPMVLSEDWHWSGWLAQQGVKVVATTAVKLQHHGKAAYPNDCAWGTWETDQGENAGGGQASPDKVDRGTEALPSGPGAEMVPKEVSGWCDFSAVYAEAVERAADGARFVEVGSWLGKSAITMARLIQQSGKRIGFTCVDNWRVNVADRQRYGTPEDPRAEFEANLERYGVRDTVNVVQMDSTEAAALFHDGSLDFVFLDADHAEASVRADIEAWKSKLRPGGTLAGHDFGYMGVSKAVRGSLPPEAIRLVGTSWVYQVPALVEAVA